MLFQRRKLWLVAWLGLFVAQAPAGEAIEFRGFVQAEYRFRQDLHAWKNTAELLVQLLKRDFDLSKTPPRIVADGTLQDFKALVSLPPQNASAVQVFYLGGHMNANGDVVFGNGEKWNGDELAARFGQAGWVPDILVIDTCHAAAFTYMESWKARFPGKYLFASDTVEVTWEIDFRAKQPLHVSKLYPGLSESVAGQLSPGWDQTLSEIGYRAARMSFVDGKRFGQASEFFASLAAVPKDETRNVRFRQSTFIWRSY